MEYLSRQECTFADEPRVWQGMVWAFDRSKQIRMLKSRMGTVCNPVCDFMPSQLRGILLLLEKLCDNNKTVFYCDPAGSGKTMTVVGTVLGCIKMQGRRNIVLVVAPPSIVLNGQWEREIRNSVGNFPVQYSVITITGRSDLLQLKDPPADNKHTWVLVSNGLLRDIYTKSLSGGRHEDKQLWKSFTDLVHTRVGVIILDEFHANGLVTGKTIGQIVKTLSDVLIGKMILMSGTPIRMNALKELRTSFNNVGVPASKDSKLQDIATRIMVRQPDLTGRVKGSLDFEEVKLALPTDTTGCFSGESLLLQRGWQALQRACIHPMLVDATIRKFDRLADPPPPKVQWILTLLENIPDDNVIIATHHLAVQGFMKAWLDKRGIKCKILAKRKPESPVQNESKPKVLLMTSKCAEGIDGLQLNYNWVIFVQPPQTPSEVTQVIGRVRRQKQSKQVHIRVLKTDLEAKKWSTLAGNQLYIDWFNSVLANSNT